MSAPSFTYSGNVYTAGVAGAVDFPLISTTGNAISYLEPSHVHVYKSSNEGATWTELARPAEWDFVSNGTVARLVTGTVAEEWIKIQRITPSDSSYITFQQSSLLTAEQLNSDTLFNVYINQESFDQVSQSLATAEAAVQAANVALATVANQLQFVLIANVNLIPANPSDNDYIEIADSTGIESFTPLIGRPAGFVGDPGLAVRMGYSASLSGWSWLNYYPTNAEVRYLRRAGGSMTGPILASSSATAAAPAVAFDGDPDTGLYSPGANELGLAVGGQAAMTFDSSRNATLVSDLTVQGAITGTLTGNIALMLALS